MIGRKILLCGASLLAFAGPVATGAAAQTAGSPVAADAPEGEIIVTAQKRSESVNTVGMSIQAASGEQLLALGVRDSSDLSKVSPGLNFNVTGYGTPVYTIRGIGFQDSSLSGSPTVTVYSDEVPLPYSVMTQGALLDVQRVEVLKGPQGTLFGSNATGGAINYIANKPTEDWRAGIDASYGRFNQTDVQGYVSGPLTDTLTFRIAGRVQEMSDWQRSYTTTATNGSQDVINGRVQVQWKPSSRFKALLTLTGWRDRSDTQTPQLARVLPSNPATIDPRFLVYPTAPNNNRASDFSACINASPFNEPFDTLLPPYSHPRPTSATNCVGLKRDNSFYAGMLRLDYELTDGITLTSLSAYEKYRRYQPVEGDGSIYQIFESLQRGSIEEAFQEVRLSGSVNGKGNWVVGGNYEYNITKDNFLQTFGGNSRSVALGILINTTVPSTQQKTFSPSLFANLEYPLIPAVKAHAGIRYTESTKHYFGCAYDSGNGRWAAASLAIQNLLERVYGYPQGQGVNVGPGGCGTAGFAPTFNPPADGYHDRLKETNVSWRVGLDWEPMSGTLIYGNISKGFKSGGFSNTVASLATQLQPTRQESLLAYEVGVKSRLLHGTLQVNASGFYYDYRNKQILGSINDIVFGPLSSLVNVPKSRVVGFELSSTWRPVRGLTLAPSVSFADSKVLGDFFNFDPFTPTPVNFRGEPFPNAPKWQANADAEYRFAVSADTDLFIGGHVNYQSSTRQFFYNQSPTAPVPQDILGIPERALIDLRAGMERGPLRFQIWGRNVTNKHYWTQATRASDVILRYTGMPATFGATFSYQFK